MNPYYPRVAERAMHRCEYCHAPEVIFNFPFEVEHIVPLSLSGTDEYSNLALACRSCNLNKSDYLTAIDPLTNEEVRLFHPRHDVWPTHFRADIEIEKILGLTPIGRATTGKLKLNSQLQKLARRRWIKLGLFP